MPVKVLDKIVKYLTKYGIINKLPIMSFTKKDHMDTGSEKEDMLVFPSADRNKEPILNVLKKYFSETPKVGVAGESESSTKLTALEISSGSGQHVSYFAQNLPHIVWQPSEHDPQCLKSIAAHINHYKLGNVLPPISVDITQPVETWLPLSISLNTCDFMFNANLIHISPWQCAEGLFKAAGKLLKNKGYLITYGPYAIHGHLTPDSNVRFDQSLRQRDPAWGIRDIDDIEKLAVANGLHLQEILDLPANNKCVVFQKK